MHGAFVCARSRARWIGLPTLIERREAAVECDNAQTAGSWPPHRRSSSAYGSVVKIQEETVSMNWRIASDRSEPDTGTLACLSNDNALRG